MRSGAMGGREVSIGSENKRDAEEMQCRLDRRADLVPKVLSRVFFYGP
jgi:hypothetical protein